MRCIVVDDDKTSRIVIKGHVDRTEELELIHEFDNAIDALNFLKKDSVDLIFLDVEMPEMTGIELVETMKALDNLPHVIVISSTKGYAFETLQFELTGFLLKPIDFSNFTKAVAKVQQSRQQHVLDADSQEDIYVKADNKIQRVKLNNILFIEALSDYVIINTSEKKYIVHSTMKGIEKRLESNDFCRVHRSYIVNIAKIDSIEDMNIQIGEKTIPIGSSYKNDFLAKLNML